MTRDRTERGEAEEQLRTSEERFRLLVHSVKDYAIFMLDPDGNVATWNEGAERIKGYTAQEIIGRHFSTFYPAEALATGFPEHELEVASKVGRFEDEGWRVRKDGTLLWASVVITALRDASGTLVGFAKVTRDLTERRLAEQRAIADARRVAEMETAVAQQAQHRLALEQVARREAEVVQGQLQQYSDELERSNRELQAFAYVASHDLQEPLRKIRAFGDVLREDFAAALGTEGNEFLQRMQNAAERMQTLINDLLAYSRVASRAQPFQKVDLNAVVADVMDTLELRVRESHATVEIMELPTLQADPVQMQQLFQNLVGNALKFFRPDVPPEVKILARPVPSGPGGRVWTELVVIDNGIGFEQRYLDRIFNIFQRLHGRRGNFEGTGVGLAICRKIAERHGGSITAESVPDQGSTFIVRLPLEQPEPARTQ